MELNQLERRELIVHNYINNFGMSYSMIAKKLKIARKTVADVINRYRETLTVARAPGGGRPKGPADPRLTIKVLRSIKNNPGTSDRDRAKKFGTSRETVRRIRSRANLKSYKAIKQPNRNDKQNLVAKKRARKLYDQVLTKFEGCLVMDDETFVKLDFKQLPGNMFYVAKFRGNVPKRYKFV
jgi:transposase